MTAHQRRLTAWQLAWLLVQPAATLPAADAVAVARVEQDNYAATMDMFAHRFTARVRRCNVGNQTDAIAAGAELDAWLADAGQCGVPTMETFAAGWQKMSMRYALPSSPRGDNGQAKDRSTG